jgi:tripartite-type tricarboxylate transporter receptor subunit TctC
VFFTQLTGTQMQHVPYRITSQLQADLVSGQVPVSFQLLPNVLGAIKSGQARALAVASAKRLPALPDVPTAAEAGVKGYESAAWFGFVAPRGTPRAAIDRLNREATAATADPVVRARLTDFGAEPLAATPEEFGRFIASEMVKWRGIITKGNITIE